MAVRSGPTPGANGVMYRNVSTVANPVLDPMPLVRDVEPKRAITKNDVSSRKGGGFKQHERALSDITLAIKCLYDPSDPDYLALEHAAWIGAKLDLLVLDQALANAGARGLRAQMKVFGDDESQMVDGQMESSFELGLCYGDFIPMFGQVGGLVGSNFGANDAYQWGPINFPYTVSTVPT